MAFNVRSRFNQPAFLHQQAFGNSGERTCFSSQQTPDLGGQPSAYTLVRMCTQEGIKSSFLGKTWHNAAIFGKMWLRCTKEMNITLMERNIEIVI